MIARIFRCFPGMEYCDLKRDRITGQSKARPTAAAAAAAATATANRLDLNQSSINAYLFACMSAICFVHNQSTEGGFRPARIFVSTCWPPSNLGGDDASHISIWLRCHKTTLSDKCAHVCMDLSLLTAHTWFAECCLRPDPSYTQTVMVLANLH